MIKSEASESFIKVISHSLAVCLTSASPPRRHQGSSLLITNTDLTQSRGPKDKTRFWTDNQPDPVVDGSGRRRVCVCDVRAWRVYFWSSALVIGPGVAVQATGRPLVRTVRKQGSFSQMTPLPPSPSSLIPTFRPRLRLLSTSSVSWGPLGGGGGGGRGGRIEDGRG